MPLNMLQQLELFLRTCYHTYAKGLFFMICTICGTRNAHDAAFCSHCGTALHPEAVTGETVRIPAPTTAGLDAGSAQVYQTPSTPAYNQPYAGYAGPQQSSNAVIALVLGVVSLFLLGLPGSSLFAAIPAVIVGRNARNQIRASNGQLVGEGMARTGIVMGWITIGLSILAFVAFCAFFVAPFAIFPFLDR